MILIVAYNYQLYQSYFTKGCREWDASMWLPDFLRDLRGSDLHQRIQNDANICVYRCITYHDEGMKIHRAALWRPEALDCGS